MPDATEASTSQITFGGTTGSHTTGTLHRHVKNVASADRDLTDIFTLPFDNSTNLSPYTRAAVPTFVRPPIAHRPGGHFVVHESWEGVVEDICDTYFVAQVVSSSNPDIPEYAEIYRNEVSPADLALLHVGGVFYWTIGYIDSPSGQRTRSSIIRFRRLPSLTRTQDDSWIGAVQDVWLKSP